MKIEKKSEIVAASLLAGSALLGGCANNDPAAALRERAIQNGVTLDDNIRHEKNVTVLPGIIEIAPPIKIT